MNLYFFGEGGGGGAGFGAGALGGDDEVAPLSLCWSGFCMLKNYFSLGGLGFDTGGEALIAPWVLILPLCGFGWVSLCRPWLPPGAGLLSFVISSPEVGKAEWRVQALAQAK